MSWFKKKVKKLGKAASNAGQWLGDKVESVADLVSDVAVEVGDTLMEQVRDVSDLIRENAISPLASLLPPFFETLILRAYGVAVDLCYGIIVSVTVTTLVITNIFGANNNADLSRYALAAGVLFTRAVQILPTWLTVSLLIVVSIVCPPLGLVVAGVGLAVLGLVKIAQYKMRDLETQELIKLLFWLDEFGLVDASPVRAVLDQPSPQLDAPPVVEFVPQPPLLGEWLIELEIVRQVARGLNSSRAVMMVEARYAMD